MSIPDFTIENHGSIFLFHPLTTAACDWWFEHVGDTPTFGTAYAVEHRYAFDIAEGISADGLEIA